jgi:hypothetical protein
MAAQIRRDDVMTRAEASSDPVPTAAMVVHAVHEQQIRGAGIAPVKVMQTQPLGEVAV